MDDRFQRGAPFDGPGPERYEGTELMGGTRGATNEPDLSVEEIMAPSPASRGRGGSEGYAAETREYGSRGASYPGGNQEVQRPESIATPYTDTPNYEGGNATGGPQVRRQVTPERPQQAYAPPPPPLRTPPPAQPREQTFRGQERPTPQNGPGGVEHHVDRVPGKKPGLLEQLRMSIVPVAFIGVGVGLLVNKKGSERREEEIHTTVRRPQGGNRPAGPDREPRPDYGYTADAGTGMPRRPDDVGRQGADPRFGEDIR